MHVEFHVHVRKGFDRNQFGIHLLSSHMHILPCSFSLSFFFSQFDLDPLFTNDG